MNKIFQSLYYQYILDKFHFFKSPKTFRVIITIILYKSIYGTYPHYFYLWEYLFWNRLDGMLPNKTLTQL